MQELNYHQEIVKRVSRFRKKCGYCNHKFGMGDHIEYVYNNAGYHPFCLGHLEKWAEQKRKGFLLEKL